MGNGGKAPLILKPQKISLNGTLLVLGDTFK
jgi:hypothetical protein